MKKNRLASAFLTALLMFLSSYSFSQIDSSTRYRAIRNDHIGRIITDQKSHVRYVLDASHIYIEAFDQNGKSMWRTDPWRDYKWSKPPVERPIIVTFFLENDSLSNFKDVLAIRYDNLGGAGIDAKTGKIITIGQD